jgi:hypothetical protein
MENLKIRVTLSNGKGWKETKILQLSHYLMEKEKGKALKPYPNYRNETMIFIIASVLIVAIQTAIPSFQTKRTFPSCVRSFASLTHSV